MSLKHTLFALFFVISLPLYSKDPDITIRIDDTTKQHDPSNKNEDVFLTSLLNSSLTGITLGTLFGYLNKMTYDIAQKHGNSDYGFIICWLINPYIREKIIEALEKEANHLKVPYNYVLASGLARAIDWLVYFDVQQFLKK